MSGLLPLLLRRIAAAGPITLADYMAECLLHPEHGYYTCAAPFGAGGDFITAPEISQMFGELIGLCLAQAWMDQGRPAGAALVELGPGRGTLMADALRATRGVAGFHAAVQVHLVEASPQLRAVQRAALGGHPARWHDAVDSLPDAPTYLIANEFFDALPIRQFQRATAAWHERMVGARDGALRWGLSPPLRPAALEPRLADTAPGDIVELCPGAAPVMAAIARRIAARGGAAVIVDYGAGPSLGDTFQALRHHQPVDPFAEPGRADLTAHVDFVALQRVAVGTRVGRVAQGAFLERLGITARARALARGLSGAALESHVAAHRRLTHPDEMGSVFQVMLIAPPGTPPLPGDDDAAPARMQGTATT